MHLPRLLLSVALPVLGLGVAACAGEEASVEERFCGRVKAAKAPPIQLDASILQDKARLKAAIDGVAGNPLIAIPEADVPPAIAPLVTQLRNALTSVRTQLVANDYDATKLNLAEALALQGAATEVATYVKAQCGVDLLATPPPGAPATTTP